MKANRDRNFRNNVFLITMIVVIGISWQMDLEETNDEIIEQFKLVEIIPRT